MKAPKKLLKIPRGLLKAPKGLLKNPKGLQKDPKGLKKVSKGLLKVLEVFYSFLRTDHRSQRLLQVLNGLLRLLWVCCRSLRPLRWVGLG